jgi:hypothetical protein
MMVPVVYGRIVREGIVAKLGARDEHFIRNAHD